MKYTLALGVLCAVPALAGDYPKYYDHKDFVISEVWHEDNGYNRGHHHHRPQKPHHPHPQKPHLEHYEKLTEKIVCEKLHFFAAEADYIYDLVKSIDCDDRNARCWEPVKKALYELEWELDLFDTKIDKSNLNKCWDCRQEGKIACCYRTYAEAIIRLLKLIKYKSEYLEGGTDKYIITAINSLRAADYTYVYELVRRMHCEKYEREIMQKQGAVDGSTHGSIREAFAEFVFTPYITGDDFKEPKKGDKKKEDDKKKGDKKKPEEEGDHYPEHHD
ncbi:hypothetical protein S40285_05798 [Stachybotrys chlorohalonatus IBT 40285]|uniref:Uncharacterized protein n=1 Tax=Stachybotrys chlorohalonatus (strain IBT 40285) TaxID=1283841 RepID=A0A084QAE3_STAC4|nr:hypothetical protein S40285_05798 [Stachybotrys chlorohalonata IBT 40285]